MGKTATDEFMRRLDGSAASAPVADAAARLQSRAQASPGPYHPWVLLRVCFGLSRCILQLCRPFFFIFAVFATIYCRAMDWTSFGSSLYSGILALFLGRSLVYDQQFKRGWLGLETRVKHGVYYKDTACNRAIVQRVPDMGATFKGTWWMPTGDLATLLTFMLYAAPHVEYTRRWMETNDGEKVALDVAFPPGGHDPEKPMILVLHGLNGGSDEPYVRVLVDRATRNGSTAVVMVARGLMDTPVGPHLFSGARTDDVDVAVRLLRTAAGDDTPLYGVGFSMGAIILANYMAVAGKDCGLTAGVALAGCMDLVVNYHNEHSRKYWQPALTRELKRNMLYPHWEKAINNPRTNTIAAAHANSIVDFDDNFVSKYHGFAGWRDYYGHMSAACPPEKIRALAVPLLTVSACDDPMICVDSFPVEEAQNNENLLFFLTQRGGHVGWPEGWWPVSDPWGFVNRVVFDFIDAHQAEAR